MRASHSVIAALFLSSTLAADVVKMRSGNDLECVVIQENTESIVVRRGYGTMLIPRSSILSVAKSALITSDVAPTTRPSPGQRVPPWSSIIAALAKEKWAIGVQQIPATVVDVGVMKSVPYQSYRCGTDYELNIYGDPDHPAAIEIGVYRTLLNSADAKKNCVEFIASVMGDKVDAAIVRALDRTKDLITRNDLTTEITPPTSPDAYGGWWVSVYGEKQLDLARATDDELDQIAVASSPGPAVARATAPPPARATTPAPARSTAPPSSPPTFRPALAQVDADSFGTWTQADLARARPAPAATGGGRVYVNGYYRKNGTYVKPYTRRR